MENRVNRPSVRCYRSVMSILLVCSLLTQAAVACPQWSVEAPLAKQSLLLDGASVDSRYIAVGERGHILMSTDFGATWTQSKVPTCSLLTAVHMHNDQLAWAVGHDAVILRTEDGGSSWKVVHHAPENEQPLLDVWFRNSHEGIAVGAYGYYLETDNGGDTWNQRYISEEDDYHLNAITPADDNTLYIAAEAGNIYRSDDIGASWYKLESPYVGSWFAIHANSENEVILAGLRGNLYRSRDGGVNWVQTPTGTRALLTDIVELPSDQLLITGLEGVLLVSESFGNNVSDNSLVTRSGISTVLPAMEGNVILLGEFGIRRLQVVY